VGIPSPFNQNEDKNISNIWVSVVKE